MATIIETTPLKLGPPSNGMLLTPQEFDAADFEPGWRYELFNGVLIVNPAPLRNERDPNEELGHWLRSYQADHPAGNSLDATVHEETIRIGPHRRRPDRVIWAGLGRLPGPHETPTIVVEFVSKGIENRRRDYETKVDEYRSTGVREYWIIDRFQQAMTVYSFGKKTKKQVVGREEIYATALLPGFELPVGRLIELAMRWDDVADLNDAD